MIDLSWCISFSFLVADLVLGAVGLFLAGTVSDLKRDLRLFYRGSIVLLMLLSLLQLFEMVAGLQGDTLWVGPYVNVIRMSLDLPLFSALTAYLLSSCGEDLRGNRTLYLVVLLRALLVVEEVAVALLGPSPMVVSDATPFSTPLLFVRTISGIVSLGVDFVILGRRWKRLAAGQRLFFLVCYFSLHFWMLLLMELLILHDQNQRYLEQKEELVRQKSQVAVLQMRPHFIYNTLTNIYYLCQDDADEAQRVIKDFSRYLQANFSAISSEEGIPFTQELEHTKAYLAVVEARYADSLSVEYDTPVTMFSLPPLTLQPIVENAVKYGISPGLDPLHISVSTEVSGQGVAIVVEDTGPGYKPSDGREPQFALDNIRERLRMMCHGSLEIVARETGGTRVTIWVPLKMPDQKNEALLPLKSHAAPCRPGDSDSI